MNPRPRTAKKAREQSRPKSARTVSEQRRMVKMTNHILSLDPELGLRSHRPDIIVAYRVVYGCGLPQRPPKSDGKDLGKIFKKVDNKKTLCINV